MPRLIKITKGEHFTTLSVSFDSCQTHLKQTETVVNVLCNVFMGFSGWVGVLVKHCSSVVYLADLSFIVCWDIDMS